MPGSFVPPLAFFGSPALLGWLAAASVPILLHLWNRRRHREMTWAAMHFLLAAVKKNARRMRIEQWLLLALRTLIIVLAVLAAAEPFWNSSGLIARSGESVHRVLVVDGTLSMSAKPTDRNLFDRAKEQAAHVVDASAQGDGFTLVTVANPPRAVVATPALEPRGVLEELEVLSPSHAGGSLTESLALVERVLDTARREQPRLTREEIYLISDLNRPTWLADQAADGSPAGDVRELVKRLTKRARLVVIDVGQTSADNLAVTSLATEKPYAVLSTDTVLNAEIRNFGRQPQARQLVELHVDGRQVGETHVDVPVQGQATATFSYRFETPGVHQALVRLPGDLLEADNHRWLAVEVQEQIRALIVDGKPGGGNFEGAGDYLAVALAPGGATDPTSLVRPEVVPESSLVELSLADYDCVFLVNVGQFTADESQLLVRYVNEGGGLVIFVGDQVLAANYTRQLGGEADSKERLLPALLGDRVTPQRPLLLDPLNYAHPLVAPFRGRDRSGLLVATVADYLRMQLIDPARARVALALADGSPLVVEEPIGGGGVFLVATSADVSWNSLPVGAAYVPLVQGLLELSLRGRDTGRQVEAGEELTDTLGGSSESHVVVQTPKGKDESARVWRDGAETRWSFADTGTSGAYRVRCAAKGDFGWYVVNPDWTDSDLTRIEEDEVRSLLGPGTRVIREDQATQAGELPTPGAVGHSSPLAQWVLAGVGALLLAETLLACLLGRRWV